MNIERWRYEEYQNQTHIVYSGIDYSEFVTYDDEFIKYMAEELSKEYTDSEDQANYILSFVQSLSYLPEEEEYVRYPVETVVDNGDCEDTAILFAAIMKASGYKAALINLEGHVLTGVALPEEPEYGTQEYIYWWEKNGEKYYTCETTGEGWNVGDLPEEYQDKSAKVIEI